MGDVYWMTAILIVQAIASAVICVVLSIKTESVIGEEQEKPEQKK